MTFSKSFSPFLTLILLLSALLEVHFKYSEYTERQKKEITELMSHQDLELPKDLDLDSFTWISNEEKERLRRFQPSTIGELRSLRGIRPDTVLRLFVSSKQSAVPHQSKLRESAALV
jgi:tRNA uridine 5-carboxymethylaminomethyl modification enzyme